LKKYKVKKGDIVIIAVLVVVTAVSFLCLNVFNRNVGENAVIEVDGEVVKVLSLDEDCTFDIVKNSTTTNVVKVENGKVSVTSADCPDKICKNHSPINKSGESIVCLPNKVVVYISSNNDEIDGVVR
jgi:hypothetical protein